MLTDLSWDQRGIFWKFCLIFRREDQGRDRINMTQFKWIKSPPRADIACPEEVGVLSLTPLLADPDLH